MPTWYATPRWSVGYQHVADVSFPGNWNGIDWHLEELFRLGQEPYWNWPTDERVTQLVAEVTRSFSVNDVIAFKGKPADVYRCLDCGWERVSSLQHSNAA